MTVFVLKREDQSDMGCDASITGVCREKAAAIRQEATERERAHDRGLIVEDAENSDVDWQVSWKVEEHDVS